MTTHCKGCLFHHKGKAGTKAADWCCYHSTVASKARSICILQGSKKVRETK
jgi:hypothetical protein